MMRGMDVFPTLCYYDTQGHDRVILRHTPHVVVMTMVRCLLGEARSVIQPKLPLSGSLCGQVDEVDIYFFTTIGRIRTTQT